MSNCLADKVLFMNDYIFMPVHICDTIHCIFVFAKYSDIMYNLVNLLIFVNTVSFIQIPTFYISMDDGEYAICYTLS